MERRAVPSGELQQQIVHHPIAVTAQDLSPDNSLFAFGDAAGVISVWHIQGSVFEPLFEVSLFQTEVRNACFGEGSRSLVVSANASRGYYVLNVDRISRQFESFNLNR